MALLKHVVTEDGIGRDVEMSAEEEAEFLASLPVSVAPVPQSITRRQCARNLLALGLIDGPAALAMTRNGTPPAMISPLIAAMPEDDRVLAEIDFAADTYDRQNPLLVALMASTGATAADVDDFFRAAAQL